MLHYWPSFSFTCPSFSIQRSYIEILFSHALVFASMLLEVLVFYFEKPLVFQ